jgi:hypothetical protein
MKTEAKDAANFRGATNQLNSAQFYFLASQNNPIYSHLNKTQEV